MAYQGNISAVEVSDQLVNARFDVKRALRVSQDGIAQLISDLGDNTKTSVVIDGRTISKSDTITLGLAVSNKMEQLQNQTQSIVSIFSELFRLEKTLGGQ